MVVLRSAGRPQLPGSPRSPARRPAWRVRPQEQAGGGATPAPPARPCLPPCCVSHPARPFPPGSAREGSLGGYGASGLTVCSSFSRPPLPGCRRCCPPTLPFPSLLPLPANPPADGPRLVPRPLVFRFSADGRPLLEGGGAGAAGSLLLAPLAAWPGAGLRLLGAPSPPEEQLLPVRLSPVGAYSPPARGALPCLASPELALLLSPLFPRSSTFPAAAPPSRQVPAPPLPPPPRPRKAPRGTRSPPPPPRLRKTDPGPQPRLRAPPQGDWSHPRPQTRPTRPRETRSFSLFLESLGPGVPGSRAPLADSEPLR